MQIFTLRIEAESGTVSRPQQLTMQTTSKLIGSSNESLVPTAFTSDDFLNISHHTDRSPTDQLLRQVSCCAPLVYASLRLSLLVELCTSSLCFTALVPTSRVVRL
jgi:hypothetical protein